LQASADFEKEGIVIHGKVEAPVIPRLETGLEQVGSLLRFSDHRVVLFLRNGALFDGSFQKQFSRWVHTLYEHILAIFFDQSSGLCGEKFRRQAPRYAEQPNCHNQMDSQPTQTSMDNV
jgi:hypothetical protein